MRMHLSSAVKHWGKYKGNNTAIDAESLITYKQLDQASEYISKLLTEKACSHKRVVISVQNQALFIASVIGCSRAGKLFILIDPDNPQRYLETLDKLNDNIYVISDSDISSLNLPYGVVQNEAFSFTEYKDRQYDVEPFAESAIIFTSGTTGKPKGVVRNNFSLLSEGILWSIELNLTQHTRFMVSRPLYWVGGFVFMYATLFHGGQLVISKTNNEIELVSRCKLNPVDVAFIVPSQIHNLLRCPVKCEKHFSKIVLTMGSPISADVKLEFSKTYNCSVLEAWGNSEGLGTITSEEDLVARPSSIGRPCFCDSLEIRDKFGSELSNNQPGNLVGQSDNQYDYYVHEANNLLNNQNVRVIQSEDIGYQDDNGFFYLFGRSSEKITINGEDIFPSYIEKKAMGSTLVKDVAIVLHTDNFDKPSLLALVVAQDTTCLDLFQKWLNLQLTESHQVANVVAVDSIPRNESGKVSRHDVQHIYKKLKQYRSNIVPGK